MNEPEVKPFTKEEILDKRKDIGKEILCSKCKKGGGTLVKRGDEYSHANCDNISPGSRKARRLYAKLIRRKEKHEQTSNPARGLPGSPKADGQ